MVNLSSFEVLPGLFKHIRFRYLKNNHQKRHRDRKKLRKSRLLTSQD